MLEKLFGDHENRASIDAAIKEGGEKSIPEQTLNEALFLYHIRSETTSELPQHIARFEKGIASYDPKNAVITQSADEWKSLVTFCRAMDAANKNDMVLFKKHVTEAFWLSPGNGEIFGAPIQEMRDREAMEKLVVDFKIELLDSEGEKTSLEPIIKDRKAVLIDFWASWCTPCMSMMPELKKKAELFDKYGIAVVGLNTEGDPVIAASVMKSEKMTIPWLVEPGSEPYSTLFRINSIPHMVLISPAGKVLYNGHPADPRLWEAIRKVAPEFKKPGTPKE